ncbi:MAG: TFIIB-type zinc ribbon-containing protein, partial [Bifidobacteriaceae bacterium]|nr:TFIIB-type zinc ribbon-containing protein [Bifidobacteriaceae bacterium]
MSQAIDYKCPKCGSTVVFDPMLGRLRCQSCGTIFNSVEDVSGRPPGVGMPGAPPPPPQAVSGSAPAASAARAAAEALAAEAAAAAAAQGVAGQPASGERIAGPAAPGEAFTVTGQPDAVQPVAGPPVVGQAAPAGAAGAPPGAPGPGVPAAPGTEGPAPGATGAAPGEAGAAGSGAVAPGAAGVPAEGAPGQASPPPAAPTGLSNVECRSCGAQIVVATQTQASTICVYCHSPVVLIGQVSMGLQPDSVVPFTINSEQAREIFHRWISKKRYVQAGFYSRDRIDKLDGIYFPYFAIDAQADVEAEGTAHYTTSSNDSVDHHYFHVRRAGEVQIENLPQEALQSTRSDKMINRLLPWNLTRQVPFAPQYLVGFQTERRDLDFEEVAPQAAHEVDMAGRRLMAQDIFS